MAQVGDRHHPDAEGGCTECSGVVAGVERGERCPELALLDELRYLRWFYSTCDFGPAHEDVVLIMNEEYVATYGPLPEGYEDVSG